MIIMVNKTKSFRFAFLILLIFPIILLFSPLRVSALGTFYNYKNGYDPSDDITDYQGLLTFLENNYTSASGTYKYIVLAGTDDPTHCRSIAFENYDVTSLTINTTGSSVTAVSVPQYRFWVQNNVYNTSTQTWYANGGSGAWLSGTISESVFKLAYSNVDFTVDGTHYNAFDTPDSFFCAKDGYNIHFGVYCNEYSTLLRDSNLANVSYFTTDKYYAQFTIDVNGTPYTVQPQSYMYNKLNLSFRLDEEVNHDDSNSLPLGLMYYYASADFQPYMRGICAKESDEYLLTAPVVCSISSISEGTQFGSKNVVSLEQLLTAFQDQNPDIVMSDLFTEITVDIVTPINYQVKYSYVIDYSSLAPDTFIPSDDNGEPNLFDSYTTLNNNFNNYFDQMFKGDIFVPPSNGKLSLTGLNDISVPDFDLDVYELDDDPITWFGAFVEWWYSSPFGLIALASLTFLIVKTILW